MSGLARTESQRRTAARQRLSRTTHAVVWLARCKRMASLSANKSPEYTPLQSVEVAQPKPAPPEPTVYEQVFEAVTSSRLNVLLVALPLSFLSYYGGWASTWTFLLSCVSLCPLAALLGDFTEDLSMRYNDTIGALLNASFGNATEMIVSIFALKAGLYNVIKDSLVGSVLGNMMLVLGTAFLAAGLRHRNIHGCSRFNSSACEVYCSLLMLATMGMLIPTVIFMQWPADSQYVLRTSRQISVVMIAGYVLYVIFQLFTHKSLFETHASEELENLANAHDDDDEGPEEPSYSSTFAISALAFSTILISFESEFLVDALEPAARAWGLSDKFISVILLPIVGNAAEHATGVTMAWKGKMDIAIGVAIGSSIQIALFVVPVLVIISWMMGQTLALNFEPFMLTLMVISVVIMKSLVMSGRSNWLSGAMLLLAYTMISIALFNSHRP
eukprot:EG_transcript_8997